ncbi:MAG: cytochrome c [Chloroflexi bacterium]|nr:cytochrome c [Chloroflexota bacterium]
MKRLTILILIAFIWVIAELAAQQEPQSALAGGWICFLCHGGFEVAGTDLAPALAGSKLTDEEILAQVRRPRGVMPAFSKEELSDQAIKDGFIQPFVRGMPAGRPTIGLDPQTRSIALATIAAVAQARATEYARSPRVGGAGTPTPAPTPTLLALNVATVRESSLDPRVLALAGGVLALISLGAWFATRR